MNRYLAELIRDVIEELSARFPDEYLNPHFVNDIAEVIDKYVDDFDLDGVRDYICELSEM